MSKNFELIKAPKRVRDWKGCKVVSLTETTNGLGSMEAGTIYTLGSCTVNKYLVADKCECCGLKFRVTWNAKAEEFLENFQFIRMLGENDE